MQLAADSVSVVLLGDWSLLYIQPEWVAQNIFESSEIEVGIEQYGVSFSISYRQNNVVIKPTQTKIEFLSMDAQENTLKFMSKCIMNYLEKAVTPILSAYGLNLDYIEVEDTRLADVFDSMSDTGVICGLGYEVESSTIDRTLRKNETVLNMKCSIEYAKTKIHFNEHHENPSEVIINLDTLSEFIKETQTIVECLGYEIEVE